MHATWCMRRAAERLGKLSRVWALSLAVCAGLALETEQVKEGERRDAPVNGIRCVVSAVALSRSSQTRSGSRCTEASGAAHASSLACGRGGRESERAHACVSDALLSCVCVRDRQTNSEFFCAFVFKCVQHSRCFSPRPHGLSCVRLDKDRDAVLSRTRAQSQLSPRVTRRQANALL